MGSDVNPVNIIPIENLISKVNDYKQISEGKGKVDETICDESFRQIEEALTALEDLNLSEHDIKVIKESINSIEGKEKLEALVSKIEAQRERRLNLGAVSLKDLGGKFIDPNQSFALMASGLNKQFDNQKFETLNKKQIGKQSEGTLTSDYDFEFKEASKKEHIEVDKAMTQEHLEELGYTFEGDQSPSQPSLEELGYTFEETSKSQAAAAAESKPAKLAEVRKNLKATKEEISNLKKEIKETNEKLASIKNKPKGIDFYIQYLDNDLGLINESKDIKELQGKLSSLNAKLGRLEAKLNHLTKQSEGSLTSDDGFEFKEVSESQPSAESTLAKLAEVRRNPNASEEEIRNLKEEVKILITNRIERLNDIDKELGNKQDTKDDSNTKDSMKNLERERAVLQDDLTRAERSLALFEIDEKQLNRGINVAAQAGKQSVLRQALKRTEITNEELTDIKNNLNAQIAKTKEEIKNRKPPPEGASLREKFNWYAQQPGEESGSNNDSEKIINELEGKLSSLNTYLDLVEAKLNRLKKQSDRDKKLKSKGVGGQVQTDHGSQEVEIKNISAGKNLVEKVDMGEEGVAIMKTLGVRTMQKAFEVDAIGALSESMPMANVVAARRKGSDVATQNVEGLVTGVDAINKLNKKSETTQHTALFVLFAQMWDLHTKNIGMDSNGDLVIFDTDQALFENNDFIRLRNDEQPPLGHCRLQDMDIQLTDSVINEHLEELTAAISSQFLGREHGFTDEEVQIIQRHLISKFADIPALMVYYDPRYGENYPHTQKSVDVVREKFLLEVDKNENFFDDLKKDGIPKDKLKLFEKKDKTQKEKPKLYDNQRHLLHPNKLSIKQLATLIERRDHLQGFVELRNELKDVDMEKLNPEEINNLSDLIIKNIDHLPIMSNDKKHLLTLAKEQNYTEILQFVKPFVGGENVEWNTLAKSMYPTMARMQSLTEKGYKHSTSQSWQRRDFETKVRDPLRNELEQRAEFLTELKNFESDQGQEKRSQDKPSSKIVEPDYDSYDY